MTLPAELRAQIFERVENDNEPFSISIAQNCIHRIEPRGCPALAALSLTCRQTHNEIHDRLYRYRKFSLDILGSDSTWKLWRRNLDDRLHFLTQMQDVHLGITLNTGTSNLPLVLNNLERTLRLLTESTELKNFTIEVRSVYRYEIPHSPVHIRLRLLRLDVGIAVWPETRSRIKIELDTAWAILDFFRTGLRKADEQLFRARAMVGDP